MNPRPISPVSQAIFLLVQARKSALDHMLRPGEWIPQPNDARPHRVTWDDADKAHRTMKRAIEHLQKSEVGL